MSYRYNLNDRIFGGSMAPRLNPKIVCTHIDAGVQGAVALIVAGTAKGEVRARDKLVLQPTGRLLGTVDAHSLDVRPGGRIDAKVRSGDV